MSMSMYMNVTCNHMHVPGVGFTNGTLQVVDAVTLVDAGPPFRYSRDAITKIAFSHDSDFMATAVSADR